MQTAGKQEKRTGTRTVHERLSLSVGKYERSAAAVSLGAIVLIYHPFRKVSGQIFNFNPNRQAIGMLDVPRSR